MTKQEFMRQNAVNQMPRMVQVLAGKMFDVAFAAGIEKGIREGIDRCAAKESEVHQAMYERGAQDATHRGSAAFTCAACIVLHDKFGFGTSRLRRTVDGIGHELICMLDPSEAVKRVRAMGVEVEYMDELMGELDEMEALT